MRWVEVRATHEEGELHFGPCFSPFLLFFFFSLGFFYKDLTPKTY